MSGDVLSRVIAIAAYKSGISARRLAAGSAVYQDLRISGDDVEELAEALAKVFGEHIWKWPWQRFADLNEPHLFTVPIFIWRLITWPVRGRIFDPSPFERLELGHIAKCCEAGHWLEP